MYRAYDPKLQREMALEELGIGAATVRERDSIALQQLVAEGRSMAKVSHPHVVAIYGVEIAEGGGVVLAI